MSRDGVPTRRPTGVSSGQEIAGPLGLRRDAADDDDATELLTAYVDGVAELSPEERRKVDARLAESPLVRAEAASLRALLARLRAPAPEGEAPDWAAMEQAIHKAVGSELPRPWWRRLHWIVPTAALAATAAMLAIWLAPASRPEAPPQATATARDASAASSTAAPARDIVALWLDGAEVDVDLSLAAALPAVLDDAAVAALSERLTQSQTGPVPDAEIDAEIDAVDGSVQLLPRESLAWVDRLDDDALDRAERWLARPVPPAVPARKGG